MICILSWSHEIQSITKAHNASILITSSGTQILIESTQVYRWDIHLKKSFPQYTDRFLKREKREKRREREEGRRGRKPLLREDFIV